MDVYELYNQKAMEMILHAGDGRLNVMQALDALAEDQDELASELLNKAYKDIQEAHKKQTSILQQIAAGEIEEHYSVLFSHAQDTLMTIYSEYNLAIKLLKIVNSLKRKIQ